MPTDEFNMDALTTERRNAIAESIHPISAAEMNSLGEALFPNVEHPWREKFFKFLQENAGATFHHATTHDRVHILYCHAKERGLWFVPGSGIGVMQPRGLAILKEIVEAL